MAVPLLSFIVSMGVSLPFSEAPCAIVGTEIKTNKEGINQSFNGYHQAVECALSRLVVRVTL